MLQLVVAALCVASARGLGDAAVGADAAPALPDMGVSFGPPSGFAMEQPDSPIAMYVQSFGDWLRQDNEGLQLVCCVFSAAVGCACAWDGPRFWRTLFTALAAATAAGVAHFEASRLGMAPNLISELVLMVQAAACVALAVHIGFEGSQVLFGALLGLMGAYGWGGWVRSLDHIVPGIAVLWYEFGAVCGFLVYTVWRRPVLATLAPMLGGFLITSAVGGILSRLWFVVAKQSGSLPNASFLPPYNMPWIDAASTLLGAAGLGALPVHCGCAMLAALLHGLSGWQWLGTGCLISSIILLSTAAATGGVCGAFPRNLPCPGWLQETENWGWPVAGGIIWMAVTGVSAWHQLSMVEDWEAANFWRSDRSPLYMRALQMEGADSRGSSPFSSAPNSPDGPRDAFHTKLPTHLQARGLEARRTPQGSYQGVDASYGSSDARRVAAAQPGVEDYSVNGLVHRLDDWWQRMWYEDRARRAQTMWPPQA